MVKNSGFALRFQVLDSLISISIRHSDGIENLTYALDELSDLKRPQGKTERF